MASLTDLHFEPTDAYDSQGRRFVLPWASGMDAPVLLDVSDLLGEGEVLLEADLFVTLWRIKAYGEADHTNVTNDEPLSGNLDPTVDDPLVTGTILSQRIAHLARGRIYRLYFGFGPDGNVRQRSVVIMVSDNS
jgi:hypothetical protein